jgi:hypothetical protein
MRIKVRAIAIAAFTTGAIALAGCRPKPLPEQGSVDFQLYAQRCGTCHVPYNPHEMTPAMWETQVTMMEVKIHDAGMRPLSSEERDTILEYLKRNAGSQ